MLLEEGREKGGLSPFHTFEPIAITEEPGYTAFGFALPDVLDKWGGRFREIAIDSACAFA